MSLRCFSGDQKLDEKKPSIYLKNDVIAKSRNLTMAKKKNRKTFERAKKYEDVDQFA